MKHFALGTILLAFGLLIVSPIEETLILIPLSTYLGMPELIVVFNILAIACLIGAVYLLGKSKVLGPIKRHWKMAGVGFIILALYLYWWYV